MELIDVYDKFGSKLGKTAKRGEPMEQGEYFLIVDVWIMNEKGEFLISKRTPTTKPEPDKWQPTTGGAIAGEDSFSAAIRETKEELGLTLNNDGKRVISFLAWDKAIIDVWLFRQEVSIDDVVLQPQETDDAMLATSIVIKELVENEKFLSRGRMPYLNDLFKICGV